MLNKNIERRIHPRGKADWEFLFAVEIDCRGKKLISEVKDISCGGLMCKVNKKFQLGKEIKIAFLLPNYKKSGLSFNKVSNEGLVIRCESHPEPHDMKCNEIAIAFQNLKKSDKTHINKYVSYVADMEKEMKKKSKKLSCPHVEHECVMTEF
ncbi:MAG: PilZ domain-containing protein [Candidatus Ancaeobacter aquaticus]|nr:PilZ domain-containing protein [Candidatus Ancaeobacter aquaticus]